MSFPNKIKVSGLSFLLQGWNETYYKSDETSDGCPVYRLDPYTLYFTMSIIGTKIYRQNGIWVFKSDANFSHFEGWKKKYGLVPQSDPFGLWTNGMEVSAKN